MLEIRIAKPCDQTWTAMKGGEQVRHCGACRKNVYNIAAMTEREVEDLVRRTEGHFCARIYRRSDGRVLTADCPRGVASVRRKRTLVVTGAFAAFFGALNAVPVMGSSGSRPIPHRMTDDEPPKAPVGDTAGIVAHPIDREEVAMGKIEAPVRMPPPNAKYEVQMGAPIFTPSGTVKDRTPSRVDK